MKFTDLSDRMKFYEKLTGNLEYQIPYMPVVIRLDGRAFHSLKLKKPYDTTLIDIFHNCTKDLVYKTNAILGYHQSDEISLIFYNNNYKSQIYFNGKTNKINSILSSTLTLLFNEYNEYADNYIKQKVMFDCRCFSLPKEEIINYLIWREEDAVRNSIQMLAQSLYSQKELHKKNCNQLQEMIFQKGYNWNDYQDYIKRGVYFKRCKVMKKFSDEEINKLHHLHPARKDPNIEIERLEIKKLDVPRITQIENPLSTMLPELCLI